MSKPRHNMELPQFVAARAEANATRRAWANLRHEPVLRMWAEGCTSYEIAATTGVPRNSVCRIVRQARLAGDPRAVSREVPKEIVAGRIAKGLPVGQAA